jgi:hypothetical protein
MNLSNKGEQPPAEREEERPQIKENTLPPSTHLTQGKERVSQGLERVRKAAREHKETKFTALLHHMTVDLLRESFYALKRKAAPGVDGVTRSIAEPTGHSHREESTSRSLTDDFVR